KEADGEVTCKFEFTNTGNEPLIIQRVTASCGCTTPTWTRQPVMPGEKGFVNAAYNPANRPGKFDKSITVQTNSATPSVRLRIIGNVIPKPVSIEDQYRYPMGDIRFKTNHLSFGNIFKGQPQTRVLEFINTGSETINLEMRESPAHIKASLPKNSIKPGETGLIEITYLSDKQNDWDFVIDRLPVYMNGTSDRNHRLIVSANIQEDFTSLSPEDRAKAPIIEFENKTFDFQNLKQGENIDYEYSFTNTGKSDLIIRKVRASCGCTAIITDKSIIPPGQKGSIKMNFNSTGKLGSQNKTITVITNDPEHPREILWIRGEVTE
ncbi:MAG: DUF1573 domain-containing protein, partial [Bacteroidales bacterium]|nr:DUF1573 domain-containing protein [Bacteroidales bacterium]